MVASELASELESCSSASDETRSDWEEPAAKVAVSFVPSEGGSDDWDPDAMDAASSATTERDSAAGSE